MDMKEFLNNRAYTNFFDDLTKITNEIFKSIQSYMQYIKDQVKYEKGAKNRNKLYQKRKVLGRRL